MCGRFVASRPIADIVDVFAVDDVEVPEELTQPRWNVSPQAGVLAVTVRRPKHEPDSDGSYHRRLTSYRWGLVPSWAKDPGFGARAFNARAESLLEKAAFRVAVAKRRCLIPADAFYEWEKASAAPSHSQLPTSRRGRRQPWCYRAPDGGLLALGGLWEAWRVRAGKPSDADDKVGTIDSSADKDERAVAGWHDEWLLSCTIITTPANETVSPVHDRMPLVLEPGEWDDWLRPRPLEADELAALLRTPRAGLLEAYEVSSEVNGSAAEGPQLVEPLAAGIDPIGSDPTGEPTLF